METTRHLKQDKAWVGLLSVLFVIYGFVATPFVLFLGLWKGNDLYAMLFMATSIAGPLFFGLLSYYLLSKCIRLLGLAALASLLLGFGISYVLVHQIKESERWYRGHGE